jgi:hypothetical protein
MKISSVLRCVLFAGLLAALGACNPTFNWRESRLGETALLAMMPCKPDTVSRQVPFVHGAMTRLTVASCEAGGLTFAVSTADVDDAAKAARSLELWREVVSKHWQIKPETMSVKPQAVSKSDGSAVRIKGLGAQPQGAEMAVEAVFFSSGSQLFQVAVIALPPKALTADISETYFGGIKLQ